MTCRRICLVLVGLAQPMSATAQVMFDTTGVTCSDYLAMSPTDASLSLSPALLPSPVSAMAAAVSVTVVGAMMLVSGIAEIVSAFGVRTWGKFSWVSCSVPFTSSLAC